MQECFIYFFKILRPMLCSLSLFIIFLNVFYLIYLFKGKRNGRTLDEYVGAFFSKPKVIIACETILALGILLSPPIWGRFENTDIGSIIEKEYYREKYYVYIRKNTNESKAYKVVADIVRGDYGYDSYADNGEETFIVQGNGYFVEKVYWNNGGYLTFIGKDNRLDSARSIRLYPGKEACVTDLYDNDYYIMLTTEKYRN